MSGRLLIFLAFSAALVFAVDATGEGKAAGKSGRKATALAVRLGLGTRAAASALLRGKPEPRWVGAAGGVRAKLPGTLRWPVTKGWFVRGFGSGPNGHHLAVDIAGKPGVNVRAAADGLVAYADEGVKGFGKLVILVHAGGAVTLYAHNSKISVVPGRRVRRGDILAELGSTGISKGPHVHFELAYGGELCDPLPLFRPAVRRRDGSAMPVGLAIWRTPAKRPSSVACAPRRPFAGVSETGSASESGDAELPSDGAEGAKTAAPDEGAGTPEAQP